MEGEENEDQSSVDNVGDSDLLSKVLAIDPPARSFNDLESYERYTKVTDQSFKLQTLVKAWKIQNKAERRLRQKVSWYILLVLGAQVLFVNTIFVLVGTGLVKTDADLSKIFVVSVFAEVVSMVLIVLNYLFPKTASEFLQLIKEL